MDKYETHEHDVVVIGAGGAGLRAAIEASAAGAKTALVCKSLLGKAHTVMAEGGVAAALASADNRDSWQTHFRATMKGGKLYDLPFGFPAVVLDGDADSVVVGELITCDQPKGHQLDTVAFQGNNLTIGGLRLLFDPHHHGDIWTVDIRIKQTYRLARSRQCNGQVYTDRGFPDTSLTAGYCNDMLHTGQELGGVLSW